MRYNTPYGAGKIFIRGVTVMAKHYAARGKPGPAARLRGLGLCLCALALLFSLTPPGKDFFNRACYELGFNDHRGSAGLLEIHIIDVGKADAILIRSGEKAALIDAGKPVSSDAVSDYLQRHNVSYLDFLIMSHPDSDHTGGMPGVLEELGAGMFVLAECFSGAEPGFEDLRGILEQKGIGTMSLAPGEGFTLGAAEFTAVGPAGSFEDPNNSSLVLRMDCAGFSALFCGDMEYEAEQALILSGRDIGVDLLKVGHHGSDTSSSLRFVYETSPKYAAVSTALDRNLLPKDEVLKRLEDSGAQIYRTDTDGAIVFLYDGEEVRVRLEKEELTSYETVDYRPF